MPIWAQKNFFFSVFAVFSLEKRDTKRIGNKIHNMPFNFILTAMHNKPALQLLWSVHIFREYMKQLLTVLWGQKDVLDLKCFHGTTNSRPIPEVNDSIYIAVVKRDLEASYRCYYCHQREGANYLFQLVFLALSAYIWELNTWNPFFQDPIT